MNIDLRFSEMFPIIITKTSLKVGHVHAKQEN